LCSKFPHYFRTAKNFTTNEKKLPHNGASSGIGFELAKIFAREGNDIVLVARNGSKLQELKTVLKRIFNKAFIISKDLSKLIQPRSI
jgi:short-subunit dehydrogenase